MPPRISNPALGISLLGLPLMSGSKPVSHAGGFTTEVSADGTTWGNPDVVVSTLISELTSGDLVQETHVGNRQPVLYVRIGATTHAGLVAGDTALSEVVGRAGELVWQPPDPAAPPTVVDVIHSKMDHQWDDMDSMRRTRTWVVSMSALPFPRSDGLVSTPAVTRVAPTVVDAGSSTTNWSALSPSGAALSVVTGAVTSTYNPSTVSAGGFYGTSVVRNLSGTLNTTTSKYLAVDWKSSLTALHSFRTSASPATALVEVRRETGATGYTRSWYKLGDGVNSISNLTFGIVHPSNSAASATLSIDQVLLANELPASGSLRQTSRTIFPGGNVPAAGTVMVQHPTTGLGQTIVFSHPVQGGYSPPLRQWRVASSTVITDANSVSGFQNPLDATMSFVIPAASIPRGDVHLWARVVRPTSGLAVINGAAFSSASFTAGAYVGDSQPFSVTRNFPANQWVMMPVARLTLPSANVGAAGGVQIDIIGAGLTIDEAWLFAMDKGRLTVLDCGTGSPVVGSISNRLRVEAPSLDKPFGGILVGTAADWSNAHTPSASTVMCDQTGHLFNPGGSAITVVTAGPTTEASVSFEHYPRWRAEAV